MIEKSLDSFLHISNSKSTRRVTLALLTAGAVDPNNHTIWSGMAAACRDAGANLICYPGRLVSSRAEFEAQRNVIYQMTGPELVDGLVVMGGLNADISPEETLEFLRQFYPRPIVTTGIVMEGFPGVTVDNYHGMKEVVTHMIEVHGFKRIAFIRGQANHQEADVRYQAYLDVLAEFDLPLDPQLVYQGDFKESGGVDAVKALLDERGVSFEALVAASDNMAIGAMKEMQARGVRIPADVAVAGVNGEEQGLVVTPPLTTAPLHFYEQAYQATRMVLDLLQGREVPPKVVLPTQMVVRQSCGCADPLFVRARITPHTQKLDSFTDEIRLLDHLVYSGADQQLTVPSDDPVHQFFPTLFKKFKAECQGKPADFTGYLSEILQQTATTNDSFTRWHEIISILRQFAISQLPDPAARLRVENLTQQARVVIGEASRRHNAYRVLQADLKLHILSEISQSLSVSTSIDNLTAVLENSLRQLNIPRCYLFFYENPREPDGAARFVFSYEDHRRQPIPGGSTVFPTRLLLPPGLLDPARPHCLTVEPIYFREDQLGYAVFEADPAEETIYEILGGQIGASLKRALLYDEALEAREAAEQANLLKSRFLSTVSHELRTPLALIVGTIEMMLQEEKSGGKPVLPPAYRQDMDSIHTSSQHLFRLIGDVLDLASNQAGELRLVREPLDLSALFAEAALLGNSLAKEKNLDWFQHIPDQLPRVMGDRTRLRQVTINLLSNAVKFTERGFVSLTVTSDDDSVLVEVSDTGLGIPMDEQESIFNEFRRSERSVERGYGGMGLGLAITRRLIELHGGSIGVRSTGEDGTGSTFFFSLPVMKSAASERPVDSRGSTVLLLVENAASGQPLREHLVSKGFQVELLDVSQQADWLEQVIACPPGAVVLDFQPATERGWELMQLLKQNPQTRDVPVIFYSLASGSSSGAVIEMDYLAKPIGSLELAEALKRLGLKDCRQPGAILIVDDDPRVLDMHARMLESQVDCRILKARGGREALEIIAREELSLVLLDLMMPEVDGFEVLRVMREQEATRAVPVIVLSAQILTGRDMQRLQEGVAAVLGKGLFSVPEILAQVEDALSHNKRLGSQALRAVREAMAYIHEHYSEPVTRAELACHVAITERYLTHCFQQELGISPMTYLNRYRVRQAKLLLEKGEQSVTEVAIATGFSDSSYFHRVFRREVGVAPGAYQKGQRGKDA